MSEIQNNVLALQRRIAQIIQARDDTSGLGNKPEVILLAVSKKHSVDAIRQAHAAGCRHFGESYVQEALPKIKELAQENLVWHFIGPIQSNKVQQIATHFDWVHSVDRAKVALKLDQYRPDTMAPLNICVQVNISGEDSKSGVSYEALDPLIQLISQQPRLRLRGLMGIAQKSHDQNLLRQSFQRLRQCKERLNLQGLALDTLSMGMTNDMEAAILEGSTIIRVGSGIFGARV